MKMKVKDGRQKVAANDARDTGLVFNKPRDALKKKNKKKTFHLASVAFILKGLPMLLHISTFICTETRCGALSPSFLLLQQAEVNGYSTVILEQICPCLVLLL